jgi:hypothetical protein
MNTERNYECKTIRLENGSRLTSVCEFNNGYSNLCVDDSCWVVVNGGRVSAYISREAMDVLMQLPHSPTLYDPYMKFIGARHQNRNF